MAVSFPRFSWSLWAQGKAKEPISSGSSSSSLEFGFGGLREQKRKKKMGIKSKWESREERKIETEFDFVVVSDYSDFDFESEEDEEEASDISIGWIEPHGTGFHGDSDSELDGGFAVLVPCYSPGCKELTEGSTSAVFRAIATNLPFDFSPDCKDYVEQVLPFRALVPRKS